MMGHPAAQPPSRTKSGSKLDAKPKHRLSGSVSSVSFSPEELSSADAASGNGGSSSASLRDKKYRRRTRSSLGGTEDLVKELDFLAPSPLKPSNKKSGLLESIRPPSTISPTGNAQFDDSTKAADDYPAIKVKPSDLAEETQLASIEPSASESITGESASESSSDKESIHSSQKDKTAESASEPEYQESTVKMDFPIRPAVNHPDVVELETQGGSAVRLKADESEEQVGISPVEVPSTSVRISLIEVPSTSEIHTSTPVKKAESSKPQILSKTFVKPTITTGSSAKSSPATSPGKSDSAFTSPAKREASLLGSPAKKETPWGSPRSTPVNSPSRRISSPITSPVKRVMSTPVKRNSPPRPEKQEVPTRVLTAKQQQEEEERKISVKKRIEELERIAGGKPHHWKEFINDGKRSGELSSSGSPLRHGEGDGQKSGESSPSGKPLKHPEIGGRKSNELSPSRKPLRHIDLSPGGSPLKHKDGDKSSKPVEDITISESQIVSTTDLGSPLEESTTTISGRASNTEVSLVVPESEKSDLNHDTEVVSNPELETKGNAGSLDTTSVSTESSGVATLTPSAEKVSVAYQGVVEGEGKVQSGTQLLAKPNVEGSGSPATVAGVEVAEDLPPQKVSSSLDGGAKQGPEASSHSRRPSFVLQQEGSPLDLSSGTRKDHEAPTAKLEVDGATTPIVNPEHPQKAIIIPGTCSIEQVVAPLAVYNGVHERTGNEDMKNDSVQQKAPVSTEVNASQVEEKAADSLLVKGGPTSFATASAAGKELPYNDNSASNGESLSEACKKETADVPALTDDAGKSSEVLPFKTGIFGDSLEKKDIKSSESDKVTNFESGVALGAVSPSSRTLDQDDDTSVLLTKQPAVDPLFVDSQQDRLWEMHSQELSRREGETSGTEMRESSAQDDDPIQYANGSPLAADVSASGATANGNSHNEKGGKVDRPRTPLRSLIAEDDAADKGGDEGAPTGKETPIVSPRGNLFRRIVSGGKASPTKPSTPSMFEKKSHSKPFLASCICCSPVK